MYVYVCMCIPFISSCVVNIHKTGFKTFPFTIYTLQTNTYSIPTFEQNQAFANLLLGACPARCTNVYSSAHVIYVYKVGIYKNTTTRNTVLCCMRMFSVEANVNVVSRRHKIHVFIALLKYLLPHRFVPPSESF